MVRSLNEFVYDIIDLYRAIYKVTDSLDERDVASWIMQQRAKFLKQRMDEPFNIIDEHNVQNLGNIAMELVDSSIGPYPSNSTILRSTVDLPVTINKRGDIGAFTRISYSDRLQSNINFVSYERAMYSGNGKFNSNEAYAYLDGKRMCIKSKSGLHKFITGINVKGVFANPIEAYEFVNGAGSYDWDMEYPISESIVADIKNAIIKDNFKFIMTPMQDSTNDSVDNVVNTPVNTQQ